ncbi:hypothetical protein [Clostridium pasteurianum]|uniref:Uncharacterized protein n=1 Tax=Clostridium pasteurianum BC1 TaxID=86416 RepID=R4K475_CLOPA|nr:hypothetical protein [Clostridium pasteurianum]AGK97388.1 hypothetical protein Clopa_2528 [Clostridium pasteurianum BC1]
MLIIEEGSKIKIFDNNTPESPLIDEIIANQDIQIEGTGEGYTILLRTENYHSNSIFESEKIEKISEGNYEVYGYFKDALLVFTDRNRDIGMYQSYMNYYL